MWSSLYADSCNEAQRACFARAMRGIARACNATVHVSGTVAADKKKICNVISDFHPQLLS